MEKDPIDILLDIVTEQAKKNKILKLILSLLKEPGRWSSSLFLHLLKFKK
jgi:hypothetical protein